MQKRNFTAALLMAFVVVAIILCLFAFPHDGLQAALRGVSIWWDVLFPALFPFFVISEIMLGFGIVHFFGTLLDPMMRPVFRIPGIGGFVMAMGFAAGYPVGAKLTSQLWVQKLVNREEGERLVAFTTSSDPIFLIGAVSIGFFHDASLAMILAIAHYGGSVLIGLMMRFHGRKSLPTEKQTISKGWVWKRAFNAMHSARINDGRSIGTLLSQSILQSLSLIFVVGGLVVFFSVVLEVLTAAKVMNAIYLLISSILQNTGLPHELSQAVMNGLFEVTLGAKAAGNAPASLALSSKVAIGAFILSWGGMSVHAQIVSLLSHTNLRYLPFVTARFIHALLSAAIVLVFWEPMQIFRESKSVFLPQYDSASPVLSYLRLMLPISGTVFLGAFSVIAGLFAAYSLLKLVYEKVGGTR
ncbi:sporulation integral membrane protein YlbJ [Paenibacillus alginolyticus]|uniref:Sporulation integral membrane protein YlbJ n=1 Tax=Paenibacillus alginolyticus TaxID=59839 RepID=A0ABT4GAZ5_9BACL|nr:sporulation integral membrane protein YlbJ [Paenibacillus alginolyticus]MCY9667920.1 sporulation integral membrane protein YlbJ [Paenibacillus alginolyticus]MCY9693359.1 sporulation integral membrane protein YlbJ [Paenibacillus alginolyticus]MEC0148108.1 sporulation integral membrane protein YlbJ [Paenibacillus alginolyticus]